MPNGGPDNCSTCGLNRRNRGIWRNPLPDEGQTSFCEIRSISVLMDHFTYCQNWHSHTREPIGPIYASGLYDGGYRRIPWNGAIEPEQGVSGVCHECAAVFADGLQIAVVERAPLQFCSNLHYMQWWQRQNPDEQAPMSEGIWEH
jgi:hypothetical protein